MYITTDEPYAWVHQYLAGEICKDKYGYCDFSHLTDYFPDVIVGRLPAMLNEYGAEGEVAKIIAYEDDPPTGSRSGTFYSHVTESTFFQACDGPDNPDNCTGSPPPSDKEVNPFMLTADGIAGMAETDGKTVNQILSDEQKNTATPATPQEYYNGTPIPSSDVFSDSDPQLAGIDMTNDIDAGSFLVYHIDHGCDAGNCLFQPAYEACAVDGVCPAGNRNAGVSGLENGAFEPVVWSLDCDVGQFDSSLLGDPYPSLAETLIEDLNGGPNDNSPSGGAVGVIAATSASGIMGNAWRATNLAQGLFQDHILDQAALLEASKDEEIVENTPPGQYPTGVERYEYFGDPSMDLWLWSPERLTAKDFSFTIAKHGLLVTLPRETHPLSPQVGARLTLTDHGAYLAQGPLLEGSTHATSPILTFMSKLDLTHAKGLSVTLSGGGYIPITVPVP